MTIIDSRLKNGTLTLDAVPFASQASNVTVTPDYDEQGDPIETLSGDTQTADEVGSYTLEITAVQDFDDPDGFVNFSWQNELEVVPFSWKPNPTAPTITGNVKVKAVPIGGDVNSRLETKAEWPIQGKPTITPYVAP